MTATEATAVLRALADAFPVPSPVWHAHVAGLRACLADFAAAIAAIEQDAAAARGDAARARGRGDLRAGGCGVRSSVVRRSGAAPGHGGGRPAAVRCLTTNETGG